MSLQFIKQIWADAPEVHASINDTFTQMTNATPELKAHRDWTEQNIFGFGERSFLWLHKLIVDEMPAEFSFMEIGVFRGAILSLYRLLADMQDKIVTRYGVTPLDGSDGHWDSDYKKDIETIHDQFNLAKDYHILHGLSTEPDIIKQAQEVAPLDILYIDGGHSFECVQSDLNHYPQLVKKGGYLIIDDCCNNMSMPFGFFQGIEPVTRAVNEWEQTEAGKQFEFMLSVVHNKIYRKI